MFRVLFGLPIGLVMASCAAKNVSSPTPAQAVATTPAMLVSRLTPSHEIIVDEVVFPANLEISHHSHPGDEIIRILSGEVVLGIGSRGNYRLCAGSVLQISAKTGHHARVGPNGAEEIILRVHPLGKPIRIDHSDTWPAPVPDTIRTAVECEDQVD